MAPSAAPAVSGTQAAAVIDKELVGRWQTGSTRATRTRLELRANGQYFLTVSGTVTDSGTMSAADGQIQAFSTNSPQPLAVAYQFDDGDLVTQGSGPFDGAEWHRLILAHQQVRKAGASTQKGGGIGQKFRNGLSAIRHFF
jgi:hypothetical protein